MAMGPNDWPVSQENAETWCIDDLKCHIDVLL